MKLFLCFFLISFTTLSQKKITFFPIKYSYAICYNFKSYDLKKRPEKFIYTDEFGFAKNIDFLGDTLDNNKVLLIEKLFYKGTFGLVSGLSKTFVPQKGIVFYNENNEPFASISIGFECGKVIFWKKSKGELYFKEKINELKAEKLLVDLKNILNK